MEDDFQKLLRITEENNAMLKEVVAYVRKMQAPEYVNSEWSREIAFNIIGNIIVENLSDSAEENIKKQFGMK